MWHYVLQPVNGSASDASHQGWMKIYFSRPNQEITAFIEVVRGQIFYRLHISSYLTGELADTDLYLRVMTVQSMNDNDHLTLSE